jgi:aspartate aminotransferase-like enzyme
MINHRAPEFEAMFGECVEGLKWGFQTEKDILIITASGTGGLESIAANTVNRGQKVLVVSIGNFGERFADMAHTYGAAVIDYKVEWGQAADPAEIARKLEADPEIQTVFITHNETSTAVTNPIQEIARTIRGIRPNALIAVDGISSIGSMPFEPDAWDVDVAVAGSQKGWMIPPGLTFVMVGPRAWERQARVDQPRQYLDWAAYRKFLPRNSVPWTPAVGLFFGLQAALRRMRAEGLQQIFARHERVARYTREELTGLGVRLLADPRFASSTVTAALPPVGVDANELMKVLREKHNVVLAEGQDALKGKLFRVGHVGYVTEADITPAIAALRTELANLRETVAAKA